MYFYSPIKERLEKSKRSIKPHGHSKIICVVAKWGIIYWMHIAHTENEGPVRIKYKFLVPIYAFRRNETARPCYFQNRIIMFCLSISTFMYLRAFYIFPGPVGLFLLQPNRQTDPGNIHIIVHRYMNVGIGNKAVQFHLLYFV